MIHAARRSRSVPIAFSSAAAVALALLGSSRALAQQQAGDGGSRALGQIQSQCTGVSGRVCTGKVCGHDFVFADTGDVGGAGDVVSIPDLNIRGCINDGYCDGTIPNNVSTQTYGVAGLPGSTPAMLSVLSAICGVNGGDGMLASGGSTATQIAQVQGFDRVARRRGGGEVSSGGASFLPGGIAELGTQTQGATIPLAFSRWISPDLFTNTTGAVTIAHREMAIQAGVTAAPAIGTRIGAGGDPTSAVYAYGVYVPLSFAFTSVSGVDSGIVTWGVGAGGIGTVSKDFRDLHVTGGVGSAVRISSGGFTLPTTIVGRVEKPLTPMFDGFVNLGTSWDFISDGAAFNVLGGGVSFGKTQLGYQGFLGSVYTAHTLGVSFREDLAGSEALAPPPPVEAPPESKPPPPTPTHPVEPPPAVEPEVPIPPGIEPPIAPPCKTDFDCDADELCVEGRCVPSM